MCLYLRLLWFNMKCYEMLNNVCSSGGGCFLCEWTSGETHVWGAEKRLSWWRWSYSTFFIRFLFNLYQGSSNLILEGRCPAEFSSNLPQHTCLEVSSIPSKTLISCFRCVWLGLELNSAGHRPSRTELGDPWSIQTYTNYKILGWFGSWLRYDRNNKKELIHVNHTCALLKVIKHTLHTVWRSSLWSTDNKYLWEHEMKL